MINLYSVKPGDRVSLKDGRTGQVVENMGDGQWLEVSFPEAPDEEPELVHSQDLSGIVSAQEDQTN